MLQLQTTNWNWYVYVTHRIAAIPISLSNLEDIHLLQAFSNAIFSYSCKGKAVDKIPTDIGRRAVSL